MSHVLNQDHRGIMRTGESVRERRENIRSARPSSKSISRAKHSTSLKQVSKSSRVSKKKNKEIFEFINKRRGKKYAGLNTGLMKNTHYRFYDLQRKKRILGRDKDRLMRLSGYLGLSKTVDKREKKKEKKEVDDEVFKRNQTVDSRPNKKLKKMKLKRYDDELFNENLFIKSKLLKKMEIKPSDLMLNLDKCKAKIKRNFYLFSQFFF